MNAVIACGGTGGHLFPGIAVAEVLRERGHEVLLFVSEKEIDSLALSTRSQFRFEKLPTVGLPSIYSPAIFGFLRRFTESVSRCRSIYQKFKPQIVLGMYRASEQCPARPFFAHPDHVHEAALVAMADSVLQEHRGFPLSIDLAHAACTSMFGPDTFDDAVRSAYHQDHEPLRYLNERETRK